MKDQRIDILKNILLELHNGASQSLFKTSLISISTGVSALEISMMEHELMSSDTGITFEDVMGLCNIHANLFKGDPIVMDISSCSIMDVLRQLCLGQLVLNRLRTTYCAVRRIFFILNPVGLYFSSYCLMAVALNLLNTLADLGHLDPVLRLVPYQLCSACGLVRPSSSVDIDWSLVDNLCGQI